MKILLPRRAPVVSGRAGVGVFILAVLLALCPLCPLCPLYREAYAADVPVPSGLFPGNRQPAETDALMQAFLGLPYRADGAIDASGAYTLFADPAQRFSTPGLNCSGLVLETARFLLGRNITLAEATRDRLGDSGPGAPMGEDWDFGWDLILNVSEGFPRRFLLPGNKTADPDSASGTTFRGYDIQSGSTWRELPGRLRPGHFYLVSLSAEGRRKGYGLQHYHVGCIYVGASGEAWFYQTTGKGGGVNRRDLKSPAGQASFKRAFANTGNNRKMLLVLETDLP